MNNKYFVIKDGGSETVLRSYLMRNCNFIFLDKKICIEEKKALKVFGSQKRFVSFCKMASNSKKIKVLKGKSPEIDSVYREMKAIEEMFNGTETEKIKRPIKTKPSVETPKRYINNNKNKWIESKGNTRTKSVPDNTSKKTNTKQNIIKTQAEDSGAYNFEEDMDAITKEVMKKPIKFINKRGEKVFFA